MKIRSKLLLALIPSIILIMALTGYITNWFAGQFLKEAIQRTVILHTLGAARELQLLFQDLIDDMEYLQLSVNDRENLSKKISEINTIRKHFYTEFMLLSESQEDIFFVLLTEDGVTFNLNKEDIQKITPNPLSINIGSFDTDNSIQFQTQVVEVKLNQHYQDKLQYQTIAVVRVFKVFTDTMNKRHLIMFSFPLKRLRNILSIYNSEKSPLHGYARSPEPRYMYIFDNNGWILCQSQDPDNIKEEIVIDTARSGLLGTFSRPFLSWAFIPNQDNKEYWDMVNDIRKGRNGIFQTIQPVRDTTLKKCFVGYAPIMLGNSSELFGGIAFVDRSRLELFAGYKQVDVMFILTMISILLACLIIFLVSKAITDPILKLAHTVDEIRDFENITDIEAKDLDYETSLLKNSINNLLNAIKTQLKEIEIRDLHIMKQALLERVNLEDVCEENNQLDSIPEIVGRSAAITKVKENIIKASVVNVDVLITGETGTGKQLVAESIHRLSGRANGPFVAINCGALEETLLLDALFGHVKGAFTEAKTDRKGAFLSADKGTLFLDEIASASLKVQQALLRAISTRKIRPLGSDEEIEVDVRLIAATNQDLKQLVQDGKFREDLFYRLNVITINVPPLRERKDDIPILVSAFLKRFREEMGKPNLALSQGSYRLLLAYDWPGNVRELEHSLKGAVAMARGPLILPDDLNLSGDTGSKTFDTPALEHREFPKLNPRERALLDYMLKGNTEITRSQYQAMADGLPSRTALYDLQHLVNLGILQKIGKGPATRYRLLDRNAT